MSGEPDSRVRLGLVGLGWWGGVLADAAERSGVARVVACHARTEAARDAFAEQAGCRAVGSLRELLAADDIEGVILATPHSVHADQVCEAAAAGRHVLVEKPFTLTLREGRRAVQAADDAGIVLMVGHQRRRQAANRRIRDMIDAGALGTVVMASSMFNVSRGYPDTWRADPAETPLGGMTGLGVHMIDTYHYLVGRIERVSAFSGGVLPGVPLDHATGLLFEFESGAVGTLLTTHFAPNASEVGLHGSEGAAFNRVDGARLLFQAKGDPAPREVALEVNDPQVEQVAEFAAAVRGGSPVETDGRVGLDVVAVLQAAVASVDRGRAVPVAEFAADGP